MKGGNFGGALRWLIAIAFVAAAAGGYFWFRRSGAGTARSARLLTWLRDAEARPEWAMHAGERCGEAPFLFPSDGLVGFLWGDSFRPGHRHQGLDIFGGGGLNQTPVVAAYAGYLSRLPDWKSSLIIRIPQDPLDPSRQIWTYYTHLADEDGNSYIAVDFPPGTSEVYVEAGRLLGYQGNYSGDPFNPTGIHLHFSIVKDDGEGRFLNELEIENTLDPSPYFGLALDAREPGENAGEVVLCP
ncbi:MAG: M23 family metallopeptidase [Chloroflexi bacterium]|nr:M23 family metallopeptidase [Chloroflexota bacterium]